MNTLLCSGGAGFIGSHIVDLLVGKKKKVCVVDNLETGKENNVPEDILLWRVDIRDIASMEELMRNVDFSTIIHLAAQPSLLQSVDDPGNDAENNILGTINLLQLANKYNVKKLIFASTSAVYAEPFEDIDWSKNIVGATFTEASDTLPQSPYGISKLAAEYYINLLFPNSVIFRLANVYGSRQQPLGKNQVIPQAIRHILYGDEFLVHSEGKHTRDFMYVGDVAKAFVMAAENDVVGTFNLSTGKSTFVWDVLSTLKEVSNWEDDWQKIDEVDNARLHVGMDNTKFKSAFGMKRFTTLRNGLKKTFNHWKEKESG